MVPRRKQKTKNEERKVLTTSSADQEWQLKDSPLKKKTHSGIKKEKKET